MKYFVASLLLLFTINATGQDSSLMVAWNKLGDQFLYRAQLFEKFASNIAKTKSIDTTVLDSLKNLKIILREKLNQKEPFDSLLIKEIKVLNKRVVGSLSGLLNSSISPEEFKVLQSAIEETENRIFMFQKQYNEACYQINRKDLVYKRGD